MKPERRIKGKPNSLQVKVVGDDMQVPVAQLMHSKAIQSWGCIPYAELSALLVELRFLYMVHQTHHWIAKGDCYYGDHLLYQRVYEKIGEHIDKVAEKAVGLGCELNVDLKRQLGLLAKRSVECVGTFPTDNSLPQKSLSLEKHFLELLCEYKVSLKQQGKLTHGVENLFDQIADDHEEFVYLFKQRCGG